MVHVLCITIYIAQWFMHAVGLPTCTSSGNVSILVWSVLNMSLAMSSAVCPSDPTRSGRPTEPTKRVSPVNAYRDSKSML